MFFSYYCPKEGYLEKCERENEGIGLHFLARDWGKEQYFSRG